MLKALLIVTSLAGGHEHSVEMPTMEECLATRTVIEEQDADIKTLCIPMEDESQKMEEFFYMFLDMMQQLKQETDDEVTRMYEETVNEFRQCNRCINN